MPKTEQIHKSHEFIENVENVENVELKENLENPESAETSENIEILLNNAHSTLIGLVNQFEKQIEKTSANKDSKIIKSSIENPSENAEHEGLHQEQKFSCSPFGMIIKISNDLLTKYFDLEEFKAKIVANPINQRRLIILDFSELKKLSSLEIGQLVNIVDIIEGEGTFTIAMHINKQVEILLNLMGVSSIFLQVRDFNDFINLLKEPRKNLDFMEEETSIILPKTKEDEDEPAKLASEIKEKLNKKRGVEKSVKHHVQKQQPRQISRQSPSSIRKSIISVSILAILTILLGIIWIEFFSVNSSPEMPTEEEINAHFNEFEIETQEME